MKLFECPNMPETLRMKLTERACAKYYEQANNATRAQPLSRNSGVFAYCRKCSIGKANLGKLGKILPKKKMKKICRLYDTAPDQCVSEAIGGKFYREYWHINASWKTKKFCSHRCAVKYTQLKQKGRIK